MNKSILSLAFATAFSSALPAFAADAVVVPTPAESGTVVKRSTTEVQVPSPEAKRAVKRGAAKVAAAEDRAEASVKRQVRRARNAHPLHKTEVTRTTVRTGDPATPVVITKEKTTTP